ncbi:MAG: hypothetical protein NT062_14895 [Proteobacteria bacterium]|nr:hypothetical protein [Pseudomonadota bacterium]
MIRPVSLLALLALVSLVALDGCSCNGGAANSDAGVDGPSFDACAGDPASFVRQTFLAIAGRRPLSQAEVDVYVDLYAAAAERGDEPRATVARAIAERPEFLERWVDVAMDALHVQRVDIQSEASCWDGALIPTVDPSLARAVRDQRASGAGISAPFTMLDLARSSIALDDLTPIYRAQLFSMVSNPIPAANVSAVEAELARRADFGGTFDSAYLRRDIVCLGCHNSETSVTYTDDPATNRHWPVPGLPEKAVYGMSTGVANVRAHAMFRVDGFVRAGSTRPWSWAPACGEFAAPASIPTDPAGILARLASITGDKPTVYDLEAALGRGFEALRGHAPPLVDGAIADPDTALAWLVTLKMTEDVWTQATGTRLTIANYFPRNQAASDLLASLATTYATSGYSLKALLVAIVTTDYWNRRPAEDGCGSSPYTYPNVFDPWVTADADAERRLNSPGDAVTAVDARTLMSAAAAALEWPSSPDATRFPDVADMFCMGATCSELEALCTTQQQCCTTHATTCVQLPFERGIGTFLRNSEAGFRGLDFQARLTWEDRHGSCARPTWVTADFIDRLATAGAADGTATAEDLIAALKDRVVGNPAIAADPEDPERKALIDVIGGPLEAPAAMINTAKLRTVCGALLSSPQFLLQGMAGRGGGRPRLTPSNVSYATICGELAQHGIGVAGTIVTCGDDTLTLATGHAGLRPPPRVPTAAHLRPRPVAVDRRAPTRR